MKYYSRKEVIELLNIDDGFLITLEQEEIVAVDDESDDPTRFSERMLERVRVAHNLIHELDVNLEGAAIILHMREEISDMRHQIEALAVKLRREEGS